MSSMNLNTTSGAAAVPNTSVLILSLGFALWYRVACICLHISLADFVLLSKAVQTKNSNGVSEKISVNENDGNVWKTTNSSRCVDDPQNETRGLKAVKPFIYSQSFRNSRLNLISTVFTYRNSRELVSFVNLIGMMMMQ